MDFDFDSLINSDVSIYANYSKSHKEAPTVSLTDFKVSDSSVNGCYNIQSHKGDSISCSISLYDDSGTLINSAESNQFSFSGLQPESDYSISAQITYDLHDGLGEKTILKNCDFTTAPTVTLNSFRVTNTDAIFEDNDVYIIIKLANDKNVQIDSVSINNQELALMDGSTNANLIVKYPAEGTNNTDNNLLIDYVSATYNNVKYYYYFADGNSSYYQNNESYITSIKYVKKIDGNYVDASYFTLSDDVYYYLTLDSQGNNIESVVLNNTLYNTNSFIESDYSHIIIKAPSISVGTIRVETGTLTYSNSHFSANRTSSFTTHDTAEVVSQEDIVDIGDSTDLLNMNEDKIYSLTSDIDLSNAVWSAPEFKGVLLGNNHSIKGLSYSGSFTVEGEANFSLFSSASGYVENLSLTDYAITVKADVNSNFGAFALNSENLEMNNVDFKDSTVIFDTSSIHPYIGGFICSSVYTDFRNCNNYVDLFGGYNLGGFACSGQNDIFEKCANYGNLTGSSLRANGGYCGGFVASGSIIAYQCMNDGDMTNDSCGAFCGKASISAWDCINLGEVSTYRLSYTYASGFTSSFGTFKHCINAAKIVGDYPNAYYSSVSGFADGTMTAVSCLSLGELTDNGGWGTARYATFSRNDSTSTLKNCYYLNGIRSGSNNSDNYLQGTSLSGDEIDINLFRFLGFDESIWNLSNIDVSNKLYPNLLNV